MSFGHFYYVKQKGGKLLLDRICYREQKRSKIHLRSLLLIWAKTWQMSVLLSNSPSSQNLSLSLKWPCQIMDGFLLDQFPTFSNLPFCENRQLSICLFCYLIVSILAKFTGFAKYVIFVKPTIIDMPLLSSAFNFCQTGNNFFPHLSFS